jgi:membrane fusion protein, adhesin transport system
MKFNDKLIDPKKIRKNRTFEGQHFDEDDLQYMSSLSAAVLQKTPVQSQLILWISFAVFLWLLIWSAYAEIDEITKGSGKVIPSNQLQVIQNLEGGIVSDILVKAGDTVTKGQVLLKLQAINFESSYEESNLRYLELEAKSLRLQAEAMNLKFKIPNQMMQEGNAELIRKEKSLYLSNKQELQNSINIIKEQLRQKRNELAEVKSKLKQLRLSHSYLQEEMDMTEPLVKKGLVAEVEFLKLKRQRVEMNSDINSLKLTIPRTNSMIEEIKDKISQVEFEFSNKAKVEWNEVSAELSRIAKKKSALKDRVLRTDVRSPVDGTISRLLVNTISGVVQPGMDIVEIVASEDTLVIETKIKPQDIAFLHADLEAMVKFTAYDFSIHGGLKGKLTHISADTITDEEGQSFYLVRIKTNKNHLGPVSKPLKIIVGMTADVDILTGKKTVLDYLLKPILKTHHNALTER